MKKINLHAHSRWSDGSGTIEEMTNEYERLGFVASIITDHDYMIKDKAALDQQREEIKQLNASRKFSIPIIQGCEITLEYGEEAVLFGELAIDHWFSLKTKRTYEPQMFDDFNHAIIWAHPRASHEDALLEDIKFLSSFHGFEIENAWNPVFMEASNKNDSDRLHQIKNHIRYEPYRNSDAHVVSMIERAYNKINRDIKDESDLIDWIRSRKI